MKFLKIAVFFIGISTFAQGKVGTVDVDYILTNMPEMASVQETLGQYGAQMDIDLNKKVEDFKVLAETFSTQEIELTIAQRREKQAQLIKMEEDIQTFQQNGVKLMELKQHELLQPLYRKIEVALDKVAKTEGYTQVMQTTSDIVYLDPNFDLTMQILSEMGITVKEDAEDGE